MPNSHHQDCKKTAAKTHKSGNRQYFHNPENPYQSMGCAFFTDDEFVRTTMRPKTESHHEQCPGAGHVWFDDWYGFTEITEIPGLRPHGVEREKEYRPRRAHGRRA